MKDWIRKEQIKMYGYEAAVVMMVGKAMDAERLAQAKRERVLNQERQTRRPRRTK